MITFVWAEDEKHGIGIDGHLPWRMPADMKHFKAKTMGHPILMGRKTFASLPHLLPGRKHLVLTHNQDFKEQYQDNERVRVFTSLQEMNNYLADHQAEEICAIGGVSIFSALKEQVDVLEKTVIHHVFEVDTYMPEIDYKHFSLIHQEKHAADEKNRYDYDFLTYKRK